MKTGAKRRRFFVPFIQYVRPPLRIPQLHRTLAVLR